MVNSVIIRSLCSKPDVKRIYDHLNQNDHVEVAYSAISSAELENPGMRRSRVTMGGLGICFMMIYVGITKPRFHWLSYCGGILGCAIVWKHVVGNFRKLHVFHHSALQGRINLTNVHDSLYDKILKKTYFEAGKESIIFIVDNVDNGKVVERSIKFEQPTLLSCCEQVFIFQKNNEDGWNQQQNESLNKFLKKYFNTVGITVNKVC